TLHHRRLALARLPDREIVAKLFSEIGPRFEDRAGGYTRIVKRHERRLGDAGRTAYLELLKAGETKVRARAPTPPPAPVPKVSEPESTLAKTAPPASAEQASETAEKPPVL